MCLDYSWLCFGETLIKLIRVSALIPFSHAHIQVFLPKHPEYQKHLYQETSSFINIYSQNLQVQTSLCYNRPVYCRSNTCQLKVFIFFVSLQESSALFSKRALIMCTDECWKRHNVCQLSILLGTLNLIFTNPLIFNTLGVLLFILCE